MTKSKFTLVSGLPEDSQDDRKYKLKFYENYLSNLIQTNTLHPLATRSKNVTITDGIKITHKDKDKIFFELADLHSMVTRLRQSLQNKTI